MQKNSIPVSVWLSWHMPRLHIAWIHKSLLGWDFFCVQVIYVSEDNNYLL